MIGDDYRRDDRHGGRGAGYLRPGAAEHPGEKTDGDCAVQAGRRPEPRHQAVCERGGERHGRGRDAAEDVAAEVVEAVVQTLVSLPGAQETGGLRLYLPLSMAISNAGNSRKSVSSAMTIVIDTRIPRAQLNSNPDAVKTRNPNESTMVVVVNA